MNLMSKIEDVVVVGGGPAGLLAGINAKRHGLSVTVFESKPEIGFIEHCAGLLSISGLDTIGISMNDLPSSVLQNSNIVGAKLFSPSGKEIVVSKKSAHACVVNRSMFDKYLAEIAIKEGVNIKTNTKIQNLKRESNNLVFFSSKNKEKIAAKVGILAEGRFPRLNKQIGLPSPDRKQIVFSSQYIVGNVQNIDPNYVELYQSNSLAPGFFSWIIPINSTTVKVGLGSQLTPAGEKLDHFITHHSVAKEKFANAKIIKRMSGAIPLSGAIKQTYTNNVVVLGDAAGQTKPTTGGGVIFGGIAAKIAAKVAHESIQNNCFTKKQFSQYQNRWKKEIGKNLKIMKLVRKYLNCLSDKDEEKLFEIINKEKFKTLISETGDVDNQYKIAVKMLFQPSLWPFFIKTGVKLLV